VVAVAAVFGCNRFFRKRLHAVRRLRKIAFWGAVAAVVLLVLYWFGTRG